MNRITVLQPHIANQIAAGEVVERPASVVKELVENAIDAGANAVTVEIRNGGIEYIRVTDNGAGIPADECLLAFERHATSKISEQEDLTHIETLGFRGEALASIAAVAQTELTTRPALQETGMRVRIEGGEHKLSQPAGCPEGTTMEVANLFFNVPARRKFLKNARTEGAYVGEYLSRVILARPDISFRFINGGKIVYQSAGDGELKNAIYCVYGAEVLPHIREIQYDDGYLRLTGYLGTAELARPNRSQQSYFLNGRYIRSNPLANALQTAYDTRLMGGRFPFAVLNITISSREVDVNVHPAKLEARFAQESRVAAAVTNACRQALGQMEIPRIRFGEPSSNGVARPVQTGLLQHSAQAKIQPESEIDTRQADVGRLPDIPVQEKPSSAAQSAFTPILMDETSGSIRVKEAVFEIPHFRVTPVKKGAEQAEIPLPVTQEQFSSAPFAIIGQAFSSYWIVQQGENLFFIDQHAAHERKLYERYMAQIQENASQTLLGGELLQLTHAEHESLLRSEELLRSLGFDIETFGATSIRVLAVPAVFAGASVGAMLRGALEVLSKQGRATTQELRRETVIQAACKHAVKAGDPLQKEEIEELLRTFSEEGMPMTCPHGRPVMILMSKKELEKLFKRIV
ncbi:MAG: DNA mismatch repair endonuclease MutL [Bacillota bacterium]